MQGDILAGFLEGAQMHKDFIFEKPGRKCCQLGAFAGLEAFDGLDEANGADGDQILQIFAGIIEFFDDMDTE
jgi:hypothetical protein